MSRAAKMDKNSRSNTVVESRHSSPLVEFDSCIFREAG